MFGVKSRKVIAVAGLLLVALLLTGTVHAAKGSSSGTLTDRLDVPECGTDSSAGSYRVTFKRNGTWAGTFDGIRFNGKYKQRLNGRVLKLRFSKKSRARFVKAMKQWATEVCETNVDITKLTYSMTFKLNKKRNQLSGIVKSRIAGRTRYGTGTGVYTGNLSGKWSR